MVHARLTEDEIHEVIAMRKCGGKVLEIADKFGVAKSCIGRILKKYGLSRNKTTPQERIAIVEAHKNGRTVEELKTIFGRCEETIETILRTDGVYTPVKFRHVNGTPLEEEICRRYVNGDKTISIINELRVGRKTVEAIIRKHGIQRKKREQTGEIIDLDALTPRQSFPVSDTFDLDEEERNRLEEIRAAKIKNWNRLHAHKKERKAYENYD